MTNTPIAMDWDLTSYFAEFDGPGHAAIQR